MPSRGQLHCLEVDWEGILGNIMESRIRVTGRVFTLSVLLLACDRGDHTVMEPDPIPPLVNITSCANGSAAGFPCSGIDYVSHLSPGQMGLTIGIVNDMWGWTDPMTGTEWALVGHSQGTSFVSLADPDDPIHAGFLPYTEGAFESTWRDIKVYRDHAFIVSDAAGPHGMQVVDLAQLRGITTMPSRVELLTVYDRIHSAHNLVINEETGFAYSVGGAGGGETCGGGLHMIDIRDPANPVFAGCFADTSTGQRGTGYTHDATCVVYKGPDTEHRGKEICFGSNESALSIADVTDKNAPAALASTSYPGVSYSHQAWLDDAHEYLYMNDEFDEYREDINATRTIVWDISDLDDPVVVHEFLGTTQAVDHNLYIVGNLMYQSNYLSGLRVIDISDRDSPREVAYFDVEPDGENTPQLAGSWSNYPFFESGIIGVTSMGVRSEGGVFFVKLSGN